MRDNRFPVRRLIYRNRMMYLNVRQSLIAIHVTASGMHVFRAVFGIAARVNSAGIDEQNTYTRAEKANMTVVKLYRVGQYFYCRRYSSDKLHMDTFMHALHKINFKTILFRALKYVHIPISHFVYGFSTCDIHFLLSISGPGHGFQRRNFCEAINKWILLR